MSDTKLHHIATVFPIDSAALELQSNSTQRRVIIIDFSLNTSAHGIPGIARSQSIHNRIFWLLTFILFTGIMLYFIFQALLAYYQYPTQTSVTLADEWPQRFPAVTICNYSPFCYDKFIESYLNYTHVFNLSNATN